MPDTLIKFKTGDLSKMDNGATDEVSINNGTVYFATDDTTKNGKIYFDSPEGDRIDMTAYAKESDYATLAGNVDGVVSVANGGTGATDAATARTKLGIPTAGTTATAVGTTAKGGSATTWSKSDHVHNITLAIGDNNGQVKIAGTNVSVKGLGSAAYTESSSYASATNEITHLKDGSAVGSLRATGTVEESSTYSMGQNAVALGAGTKASGIYSYAEGGGSIASNTGAHAEGSGTKAEGSSAHAEGGGTTASGSQSHAEGGGTTASGDSAHAEGSGTTAYGDYSHAEGFRTTANHRSQHVFGEYNILDPSAGNNATKGNYVEIVGNGTSSSAKSNARTLDWNGNEILAGKLTIGTDPTNNMDVATKQYVDNAFSVNDAMVFKGVLDSPSNIPDTHQAGWTYRIGTTGTYAGQICEVGDLLICVADGTEASNNDWNVVQNNLDGALFKGNNTFTDGQVLIADGITGKTKTSGFTIGKSVPSDALFTDTIYTHPSTTATAAAAVKVGNDSLGHVILGDALTANDLNSVAYIKQTLTDPQKTQARSNISAAGTSDLNSLASSFSGALNSATGALSQAIATNFNNSVHITAQSLTENQKNQVKDNLSIPKNIIDGSAEKSLRQLSAYPETAGVYSLGSYAIALGSGTRASGANSIAEGWSTLASGENSHAEGSWSESTSQASHAEGYRTKASSNYAHAEGTNTLAAVGAGHAEGNNTIASGTLASHTEGSNTMASGMYAHAEGSGVVYSIRLNGEAGATTYTLTTPVEIYPWSMGSSTFGYVASGYTITKVRITAITKSGNNITSITVNETLNAGAAITDTSFNWIMPQARGAQSHTEGLATVALGSSQHAGGQYNIPDSTSLEIIGNGTSNLIRSNARTLDKNGNEVLAGKLTVGTQATADNDVPTLAQVRALIQEALNQQQS